MALLHRLWNLKASVRSTSVYKGELLPRGLIQYCFGKVTPGSSVVRVEVSDSVSAAGGHSQSCRCLGSSFIEALSSSRVLVAHHNLSTISAIQLETLHSTKSFSHVFCTTTITCHSLQKFIFASAEVARKFRGSFLWKQAEAGLNLLPGQSLGGVLSHNARAIVPNQGIGDKTSEQHTQVDEDGVAFVEACTVKSKPFPSVDCRSFVNQGIAGLLKGEESLGFESSGCHELRCAEDLSRNVDNEEAQHRNFRLLSGVCCLPHPSKAKNGGEDAFFMCFEEQVVGVADGVGGWADVGVDAGDYARELMFQAKLAVGQEPYGYVDPAHVMIRAYSRTKCRGSSTACILALSDDGLQAANLGDSGFMLMRNGRTVFKSPVQQHQFNIPFQLESGGSDPPSSAEVFSLQVVAGDVLVVGTDGLFDNLYDNELIGIVMHSMRAGLDPEVTAQKIASLARERAQDCCRQTPFSTAAQEAGFRFYGGKMDDITVIVSYVTANKPGISDSLLKL